jgi:alkyl hydroperoxide reductase subunit AhpC
MSEAKTQKRARSSSDAEDECPKGTDHCWFAGNKAHVTAPAPAFTVTALKPDQSFGPVSLSDYKGKYVVLFFYPLDFTFVCPTEIIQFSDRAAEFAAVNCALIGASVDSQFSHLAWTKQSRKTGGLGSMNIPLLADVSKSLSRDYGVLIEGGISLRGLFIIDGKGIIRQITKNDLPVGRNVDEVLRLVKAFQFVDEHGEVCPANWTPGAKTMKADPQGSQAYFQSTHL